MKKWSIILLIILLISSSNFNHIGKSENNIIQNPLNEAADSVKGFTVTFELPELLLNTGSLFNLNVTIINERPWPRLFSVVVFSDYNISSKKSIIQRIGNEPIVRLQPFESVDLSITCLTYKNTLESLDCLETNSKTMFNPIEGKIGIKITKGIPWLIDGLIWNRVISEKLFLKPFCNNVYFGLGLPFLSRLRSYNPNIIWKDVCFSEPFVCTKKITLNSVEITTEEEGDQVVEKNEGVYVKINLTSNLRYDYTLSVLVDMANEKIINDFMPTLPDEIYNLAYNETEIDAKKNSDNNNYIIHWVNFTFPNQSFFRKNYTITVECSPYIDIQNSNLFGLYTFNYRYNTLVTPFYYENETVKNAAEHFWYNLPIFKSEPSNDKSILFSEHINITYDDKNPVEEYVEQALDGLKDWIFDHMFIVVGIVFILLLPSILVGLVVYWFIRKKT